MASLTLATVGGRVAAALVNQIIAILTIRTSYTPTITNFSSATTSPTITGSYTRAGNVVTVCVQGKLGTGSISVGSITATVPPSLPIDTTGMIANSTALDGTAAFNDINGSYFAGPVQLVDANTVRAMRPLQSASYTAALTGGFGSTASGSPFTWAAGDEVSLLFSYVTSA